MRNYLIFIVIIGQSLNVFTNDETEMNLIRNSRSPQRNEIWDSNRHGNGRNNHEGIIFEQGSFGNDPYAQGNFEENSGGRRGHNGGGGQHGGGGHNGKGGGGHHHGGGGNHGGGDQYVTDFHFGGADRGGRNSGEKHYGGGVDRDWRPRRPHGRPPPPPGYSGYRPEGWGHGGYTYDERGDKERRVSQIRFEEYMKQIYGKNFTEENSILTPDELNGRQIAAPGEFRHMAVIGLRGEDRTKEWKCGASLIDVNFVLTAAHCTDFGGQPPTHVKIGDINLKIREDTVATQRMKIADIYVHPNYKKNSYYYDIALIRLSKPAVFTRHVRPARLWTSSEIPYELVFAMGYGATTFGKAPTEVLTFFNFTLIGNQECNRSLPINDDTPKGIIESQICAIDKTAGKDTCQGDSGGPLQLHLPGRRRTRYYLVGITSYGLFCGSKTPSVYTRIYSFLDWIEGIVWPEQ